MRPILVIEPESITNLERYKLEDAGYVVLFVKAGKRCELLQAEGEHTPLPLPDPTRREE